MESGKKTSIFSDRGSIGSADELDEYGVWVKIEPEDIAFDDGAFLAGTGKASEVKNIGSGLDFDPYGTGTYEADLVSGGAKKDTHTVYQKNSPEEGLDLYAQAEMDASGLSGFDIDFEDGGADDVSLEAAAVDSAGFDTDFGDGGADDVRLGAAAVDSAGLGIDFGGGGADDYDFEISLDDIPETPQTGGEPEAPKTDSPVSSRNESPANELLLKIVDELSTIKAELNSLKDEISTIRGDASGANDVTSVPEPEPEPVPDEFGSETLSAAELDAMLNNVKIESTETGEGAPQYAEIDAPLDSPETVAVDETSPGGELDSPEDRAGIVAEPVETVAEAASLPDDTPVDLDLDETSDQASPEAAFDDFTEDSGVFEKAGDEDIVVPAPDEDTAEAFSDLTGKPDYLSPDEFEDINESRLAEHPQPELTAESRVAEIPPETPETTATPATSRTAVQNAYDPLNSAHFRKDLQIVLSYMDKLLEALPDEKIEEFALSEQFDTYKKVFRDLGLV
ncbi:MAG: hypothetical protein LBD86_07560 [Spirochaetaceae bacterium]|jgi:hypothetical protein|nr:hypothetical protein [Spirochaetaceae bacterium]